VTAQLIDAGGTRVGQPFSANISANQDTVKLQTKIERPKTLDRGDAKPLQRASGLVRKLESVHVVSERFGFRTFEVRAGDGLY